MPGLIKRGRYWHISKRIFGSYMRESTGTPILYEAESILAKRIEEIRQAKLYGVRPKRSFKQGAIKYLLENQHKASIEDDAMHIKQLCPFIGTLTLEQVHMGSLQPFIQARKAAGRKIKTINNALGVVRHLLNLAASTWIDEHGLTWLAHAPIIKLLPNLDARPPYPITWDEQDRLFNVLPEHLRNMAIFKVNTGCREQEVCQLQWQWQWEIKIPELKSSVFIIPKQWVKNREERLVVLNQTAYAAIEKVRGNHPEFVFTYKGKPISKMNSSAWRRAREKVGLVQVRIHDLKHTFGQRLRAAGVNFEDRQDLLGHKSGRITTHYCAAQVHNLISAANKVCERGCDESNLALLKVAQSEQNQERKTPLSQNYHNDFLGQKVNNQGLYKYLISL